jgi:beta-fructofuranosidase
MSRTVVVLSVLAAAVLGLSNATAAEKKAETESGIIRPVPPEVLAALKKGDNLPQSKSFMARRLADIKSDRYYPIYHYANRPNSLHDPNGFCVRNGVYHLFYQSRPYWGHAYSRDLVHWRDLPQAFGPSDGAKACFSGAVLVEKDRAIALYPAPPLGMRAAISTDPILLNWKKISPKSLAFSFDGNANYYHDSFIWKEEDGYYALVTGKRELKEFPHAPPRTAPRVFRSKDLLKWEYVGCLLPENEKLTEYGDDPSCSYFLPIGKDKHILITFSHVRGPQYMLGDYDKEKHLFTPYARYRFNRAEGVGNGLAHAPSAISDGKGGVFLINSTTTSTRGVQQVMTLPMHLTLDKLNRLRIEPVKTIESARKQKGHVRIENRDLPANKEIVFDEIKGDAMEISAVIQPGKTHGAVRICAFRSADKREYVAMTYYRDTGLRASDPFIQKKMPEYRFGGYFSDHFVLDTTHSSIRTDSKVHPPEVTTLDLAENEPLRVRIFIDRSIVEVFVQEKRWMMMRVTPALEDSVGFSIESIGNNAKILTLDAWQMKNVYE